MRRVYYPFHVLHSITYSMRILTTVRGWFAGNSSSPGVNESLVSTRALPTQCKRAGAPALLVTRSADRDYRPMQHAVERPRLGALDRTM